ncbi:MAG: hypothetical protein AB7E95_00580 [Kiritimatiellales bacterium]
MHFDILVEDVSGKRMLDLLVPKILGEFHTFQVHHYKGIGRLPKGMASGSEPQKRILLDQLPRVLQGFGKTYAAYPAGYQSAVVVVCDLDDRCLKAFRAELLRLLQRCNPAPEARFCIAVEEGEAWFFGDLNAVRTAYPHSKDAVLSSYANDSICGTWEKLADAVYSGGAAALKALGWTMIGREKSIWADAIAPNMDVNANSSPSFCYFRDKLRGLAGQ